MSSSFRETTGGGALPRHYLKPCLLLLLAEGPSHGYDLLEQVRRLGINGAEPGGLYRYLRSMEKEELVSSWWEPSQAGPARRTYILTDRGRQALDTSVNSLRDVREILVSLLDRYDVLGRGTAREAGAQRR
ncbi:MAG: PadR family transcriptional regulator [Acidimicrobiales bacterium]